MLLAASGANIRPGHVAVMQARSATRREPLPAAWPCPLEGDRVHSVVDSKACPLRQRHVTAGAGPGILRPINVTLMLAAAMQDSRTPAVNVSERDR